MKPQSGGGSSTSALAAGGGSPGIVAITESWDGTSWTEVADLATARVAAAGSGTGNTSGFAVGGEIAPGPFTNVTEEFNDPSYTIKTVTTS